MDIIIYNKIKNVEVRDHLLEILGVKADTVYSRLDLLIIHHEMLQETPEEAMLRLQEFLHKQELDIDDIIYIFYPVSDNNLGMWPVKRAGRKRIQRTLDRFNLK